MDQSSSPRTQGPQERAKSIARTSLSAFAAFAAIGAAFLTSTSSADARPGFGGFRGGFHGGFPGRVARFTPHRPHRPHWHVKWHRPVIYGVGAAAIAAPAYAVAPKPAAPGPCTCLSKAYTQDNVVVFKDRCTNEMAAAPMGGPQQQSQAQPEPGDAEPVPQK